MSRKDTLISAILINIALLGFLFILAVPVQDAVQTDASSMVQEVAFSSPSIDEIAKPQDMQESKHIQETPVAASSSYDELDELLSQFKKPEEAPPEKTPEKPPEKPVQKDKTPVASEGFQLVTVSEGDYLGKIAKKYGTTVAKIKAMNSLTSESIRVGQQIKVPASAKTVTIEDEFYTLKNGDNPWKISKQFNVPFYKLLEINNLDQDKALRLKPGDKLRVR